MACISFQKGFLLLCLFAPLPFIKCCSRSVVELYNYEEDVPFEEVCFKDVGCFNNTLTSHQPGFPPLPLDGLETVYYLYNRERLDNPEVIDARKIASPLTTFEPQKATKVLIHGYNEAHSVDTFQTLKNTLLIKGDFNVLMVDYNQGAIGSYNRARQNARVVGRQLGSLIRRLQKVYGSTLDSFHLIGHSLGAHVAGYAGEHVPGIGRITGLDPAGPGFFEDNTFIRLDATDAKFVDVLHTNGAESGIGLGLLAPLGHQDFYPNGGSRMPGCGRYFTLICNHYKSVMYFMESILSKCQFIAYPCDSWESYEGGECNHCGEQGCATMGYNAEANQRFGSFYLTTNSNNPYCT